MTPRKSLARNSKIPADKVKQMVVVQNFDPTYNASFRKAMDELNSFMMSKGKSNEKVNWSKHFDTRGLNSVSSALVK